MAIAKCECGFSRKFTDENIGKKGKCPRCQKIITIESEVDNDTGPVENTISSEPAPVTPPVIPQAGKAGNMAIAKCECGFSRKFTDENIGKKGKCPKCQKIITIESEMDNDTVPVKNTKSSEPTSETPPVTPEPTSETPPVTPEPTPETPSVTPQAGKAGGIEWHFSLKEKKFGPVSDTRIHELIKRKRITEQAMVWNQSMPEWVNVMNSQFADHILDPQKPPPLSGEKVNNTIVWALAFAIIIGLFLEGLISGLTGINQNYLFFITIGLNIWLCILDEKKLVEAGYDTSDMGNVWLVPVYLFKRAKKLGHNYAYFIVWCVIFGLYLFV